MDIDNSCYVSRKDKRKNKKKNKIKIIKHIILFFVFEVMLTTITFPLYIFYGPFKDVRNLIVEISMSTGNHQYIAKLFLNDEEIDEILNGTSKQTSIDTEIFSTVESEGTLENIIQHDITDEKFDGIALVVKDPIRVKVGYSSKLGEVGETISKMASNYNAVAAINGGGYEDTKGDSNGGIPIGILISDGNVIYPKSEKKYNDKHVVFSIDSNGKMFVGEASVNELLEMDSQQAMSFGPTLIVDGEPYISETTVGGINPRTAIGQMSDGSIILLTIDGRKLLKQGAKLEDVQEVMYRLGAVNAMCLDGGGSTAMYYNGEIINNISNLTGERCIPDIVYVK